MFTHLIGCFSVQRGVVVPPHALTLPEEPITGPGEHWCEVTVSGLIHNCVWYCSNCFSTDIWAVFSVSGEWFGQSPGAYVCGAICGAQATAADEATAKFKRVRFRIAFTENVSRNCLEIKYGVFVQIKWFFCLFLPVSSLFLGFFAFRCSEVIKYHLSHCQASKQ